MDRREPAGWFRGAALVLPLLAGLGCQKPVPRLINLYEISGTSFMRCDSAQRHRNNDRQGGLECRGADGETFQGEWMTMARSATLETSGYWASMPPITGDPLASRWNWAASFGVDLENLAGPYGVFLLYGSRGTVIDGVFLFQGASAGILGAATDNKGHRYKVMG